MLNGHRLKYIRKKKGLTQSELGDILGLDKSTISCYEKELRCPHINTLIELMHIFGVSADYLLGADYFIKTTDNYKNQVFATMTKGEITFIEELRKNKIVYNILFENPRRGAELIKREIG